MTRSDGNNTKLTHSYVYDGADWSPDGNKVLLRHRFPSELFILDENGHTELVDNTAGFYYFAWSPETTTIAFSSGRVLGIFDLKRKEQNFVVRDYETNGMSWLPDGKNLIWSTELGLYKVNVVTNAVTKIKTGCQSRLYSQPAVSADGSQIIVVRTDSRKVNDHTMYTESHLYIMNADGSNERKVEF
jgi:Tol biopolymer transport system component